MEQTKINNIIGYVLLVVGLLLILVPLYQTYNIFTGKALPVQVFKKQAEISTSQNNNSFDLQQQVQNAMVKVLPVDLINNVLNLASWMILMMILVISGGQIANLGIRLVK